ncbi:Hypothetical protein FKW44_016316 [Caligus rogercresseyi]|uniref:Class II aldolase/adducin N-terminal domain-containing protein n=1 Tax=Caligus rogercresseyi TaxID=217165 RepID=A0A7T8H1R2_CALRO|nr:Hypothetical protein FKW44_016316 [Caligus rogercresseyi]
MAAAFRLTAREDMHEGVANHFSLAVNDAGTQFLINPKKHFSVMKASDLWVIDADDPCPWKATTHRTKRPGACMPRFTATSPTPAAPCMCIPPTHRAGVPGGFAITGDRPEFGHLPQSAGGG